MGPENLHALFFGLSVGLAGFVVLLVLVKILRRSGVIPYPPFKSRAEYLEAALEMNLEIFIERAKATPRSITQKLPAPTFKMMDPETSNLIIGTLPTGIGGQISKDLNLTMADQESIFKTDRQPSLNQDRRDGRFPRRPRRNQRRNRSGWS